MELRFLETAELRTAGVRAIEGYAAVFGSLAKINDFYERFLPGAFRRALDEKQDVRCTFNHNHNNILGRSKAGTLEVAEDSTGLHFRCEMPDTEVARDLATLIKRGDIAECSISFRARDDDWSREVIDGETANVRTLRDVDVFDLGPVTYPAYSQTSVSARSSRMAKPQTTGLYVRRNDIMNGRDVTVMTAEEIRLRLRMASSIL
jgi:HK97 family phage prohead protease